MSPQPDADVRVVPATGSRWGLLAYRGQEPAGWLQVGPRGDYPRVTQNRAVAAALGGHHEEPGVWRTTCFVVRVGHRRRGTPHSWRPPWGSSRLPVPDRLGRWYAGR